MKLGVLTVVLQDYPLDSALEKLASQGVEAVEIGCGGYPGKAHCDPQVLLSDAGKLREFKKSIERFGLEISSLSCHTNPVHPDPDRAALDDAQLRDAVRMAEALGVERINTFSGCPGGAKGDRMPNWITCAWPPEYLEGLDYQWNEVLIPYWQTMTDFAVSHGVTKIGFELHPGFCVYNTETMKRIRAAVGENIGANLDPSHLIWQGMEPVRVIRELGDAIFHFHAKDTHIDMDNVRLNGVLDTKHYSDEAGRSWIFRTVGYGNGEAYWRDIMSALRIAGYDHVVSIEHEDSLMSGAEGLQKAIAFLKPLIISEKPGPMYWA